jgi:hypothetical protein
MSSLKTIFLTRDNEHCFVDMGEWVSHPQNESEKGYPIILEMSKQNVSIEINNEHDLVISIKPGTELHDIFKQIKWET